MNLLLDTHVLLWWLSGERQLSPQAQSSIAEARNKVYVSAASVWEIAIKRASGKIKAPDDVCGEIEKNGMTELPITAAHAEAAGELPNRHSDPFDRMLVAQAMLENLTLVTRDERICSYQVPVLRA